MSSSFLNRRRASAARFALVSCAAAITSCAVLTVDVDVYKGVLSHHEDVQLQEMITLTSAAKPLLTELRDKLEWRGRMEVCRERAIRDRWYSPDYVPDQRLGAGYKNDWADSQSREGQLEDLRESGFKRTKARRVNAVLSLYEDRFPDMDPLAVEDLRHAYEKFRVSRARFAHVSNLDLGLIEAASAERPADQDLSPRRALTVFLSPKAPEFRDARALLSMADVGRLRIQNPEITARVERLAFDVDPDTHSVKFSESKGGHRSELSSNATYQILARPSNARAISESIFTDRRSGLSIKVKRTESLARRIRTIAIAFLDARSASSDLIESSLRLLEALPAHPRYDEIRHVLSQIASELIDPSYVLAFLAAVESGEQSVNQERLLSRIAAEWNRKQPRFVPGRDPYLQSSSRKALQASIESALAIGDKELIYLLLACHDRLPDQGNEFYTPSDIWSKPRKTPLNTLRPEYRTYFQSPSRRDYGLALGTTLSIDNEATRSMRLLAAAWARFENKSDLGLGTARLDAGLNTLISDYLEIHGRQKTDPRSESLTEELRVAQTKTREGLVRFANKLLVLSNTEELLEPVNSKGLVAIIIGGVNQQIAGGTGFENLLGRAGLEFDGSHSQRSIDSSFARVLQATGNSILILADAQILREDDRHRDKAQAAVERTAVKGLAASNALEVLGEVSMQLSAESGPYTKKAKALTDAYTAKKVELEKLVGKGGTVDDLKAGPLKLLSDKIEGLKAINAALTAATEDGKGWIATTVMANTNLKPVDEALKNYLEALAEVHMALPPKPKSPAPTASGMQLPTQSVKVPGDSKLVALIDEAVAAGRLVEAALDKGRKSLPTSTAIKVGEEAIAGLDPTKLKDDDGKKLIEIRKSIAKAELSKRNLKQTDAAWDARKKDLIADLKKLREQACSGDLPTDTLNSSCKRIDEVQTAIASYLGDLKKWRTAAEPSIAASDTLKTIAAAAKTQLAPVVAELEEGKKAAKSLSTKIAKEEKEAKAQGDAAKELTTAVSAIAAYIKAHSGAVRQDNGAGNSTPAKPNGTNKKKDKDKGPALIPIVRATGSMDVADSNTEEDAARPAAPTAAQSTSRNLIEEGPSDAIINLIAWLGEQGNADHKAAAPVISARRFSIPSIDMEALAKADDPRLVLDYLLGSLQHAYIDAVRKGGADSDSAKRLNAAYDAAVARRASMVRVIPASSYLSSSFPATTLQSNPTLGGTNELRSDGIENIPIIADIRNALFPAERDAERIQSEIDKQNWQNINRVRVSGTGKTNYAIAKDDLGNWYVKAYSADPNKILGAARNLALGSLGNEIGGDVLSRAQRLDAAAKGQPEPDLAIERTALGRLQTRYREDYEKALTGQQGRLADDLKAKVYEGALNASWAALEAPEELKNWKEDLKGAVTTHLEPTAKLAAKKVDLTNDSTADDNHLDLVTDSLNGVLTFFRTLDGQLMTRVATAKSNLESSSDIVKKETEAVAKLSKNAKTAEDTLAAANKALADLAKDAKDEVVTKAKELVKSAEADAKTANEAKAAGEKTLAEATAKEAAHKTALAKNQAARERARDVGRTTLGRFTGAIETALTDYASGVKFLSSAVEEEAEPATATTP